jgi:RHS repeat-associated protein
VTLGFGGHEHDLPALINMGGRIYDSSMGRFMTPDPHGGMPTSLGGYDRYAYAMNNPLKYNDPTGFDGVSDCTSCAGSEENRTEMMGTTITVSRTYEPPTHSTPSSGQGGRAPSAPPSGPSGNAIATSGQALGGITLPSDWGPNPLGTAPQSSRNPSAEKFWASLEAENNRKRALGHALRVENAEAERAQAQLFPYVWSLPKARLHGRHALRRAWYTPVCLPFPPRRIRSTC